MSELRDGSHVSYLGDGSTGRTVGEHGQVLYITGSAGHVKWADQRITLEDLHDLAPLGSTTAAAMPQPDVLTASLNDSLDVGWIDRGPVITAFRTEGSTGVIHMLASEGKLTTFPDVAQEALHFVEARVRRDPALLVAVASLDPDDADQVFMTAARTLLRDAFSSDGVV